MKIVLTGSLGNIGKPLTKLLVEQGHSVTVISSKTDRRDEIEALNARPAIGTIEDVEFLTTAFEGADAVYLMETLEAAGGFFNKELDYTTAINGIVNNYKQAVLRNGVKRIIHLSSVGAHTNRGNGILQFHYNAENILKTLAEDVHIKFMRPAGFYTNMFSFIRDIKSKDCIISNYTGDIVEPWVSPTDIATVVAEEMNTPFSGRTIRYIASDEFTPNEIAKVMGEAIGKPGLKWAAISSEELLNGMIAAGMNVSIANGLIEMQQAQGTGLLYEDYYRNRPALEKIKLADFAKDFAAAYHNFN